MRRIWEKPSENKHLSKWNLGDSGSGRGSSGGLEAPATTWQVPCKIAPFAQVWFWRHLRIPGCVNKWSVPTTGPRTNTARVLQAKA